MSATELANKETRQQYVRELWCEGCGCGVIGRRDPPQCPMCRQTSWRERPPLARYN